MWEGWRRVVEGVKMMQIGRFFLTEVDENGYFGVVECAADKIGG